MKPPPPSKPKRSSPRTTTAKKLAHAQKITHRAADGTFKPPPQIRQPQPPTSTNYLPDLSEVEEDPGGIINDDLPGYSDGE